MPLGYYHPQHAYSGALSQVKNRAKTTSGTTTQKTLTQRVVEIIGYTAKAGDGTQYTVVGPATSIAIRVRAPKTSIGVQVKPSGAQWAQVATAVLNLYSRGGKFFQAPTKSTGGSNTGTGAGSDAGAGAGAGAGSDAGAGGSTGTQAPAWASNPYIAEMTALVGKTLPSNVYPTRTFTIKTVTLDGVEAPAITVVDTSSGTVEVDPKNSAWIDTASQVLAASYAAASGSAGSSGGASSGGGTMVVVTDTSTPTVVTPEQALADEAVNTVDEALAPAPEVMTVSTDAAKTTGEEGFFSKYKWWLLGGAAIVAYTQREAIMKMVKK